MAKLSLLVLRCADLTASVAFYRALGLDFQEEQHGNGPQHFACEEDGFVFELYPSIPFAATKDSQSRLGFRIASVESAQQNLKEIGIEATLKDSSWGARLILQDPDGRTVEIGE